MSAKKRKDNLTHIATVREIYLEELSDPTCSSLTDPLWKFSHAADTPHQIAALRHIVKQLREGDSTVPTQLSVDILISTYLDTLPRHPLKRALASSLQNLVSCDVAVDVNMGRHLVEMCGTARDSVNSRRKLIDNMSSLTENFPLGEQSLKAECLTVLEFLESSLDTFMENVKSNRDPTIHPEVMHHCLVTVQMINKLLHKICDDDRPRGAPDTTDCLAQICANYFHNLYDILTDDTWTLDCRAACGLGVPLVHKLLSGSNTPQILHFVLLRDTGSAAHDTSSLIQDICFPLSGTNWVKLSPVSYTCILCGMLAMLDSIDLLEKCCHDNTCVLLTCIADKLFENIHRLSDPGSKLLASRALTQLTARACNLLDAVPTDSRLAACFHDDGDLLQLLVNYAWTSWEDPVDAIRREAKGIFDATLRCHLKSKHSEAGDSAYIESLVTSLLSMSWLTKGKYGPLSTIMAYTGASRLLRLEPALPHILVQTMSEQTLACYVGELFEKLFVAHLTELKGCKIEQELAEGNRRDVAGRETAEALHRWHVVWLEPLLQALCTGSPPHRKYIVEYLLPKLLKHSPGSIHYITNRLSAGSDTETFGTLVTCLKHAKTLGVVKDILEVKDGLEVKDRLGVMDRLEAKQDDVTLWNGIIAVSMLEQALVHQDEQTRLDAYGMLCEDPRTTEIVTNVDLGLIRHFLPFNINNQSPAFRQHVVALTKKLFMRLKESGRVVVRRHKTTTKQEKAGTQQLMQLSYYKDFLQWLCQLAMNHLHPEAAFPARTTALSLLTTVVHVFGAHDRDPGSLKEEFHLVDIWPQSHVQTLLECLHDTFEENKVNAFTVLAAVPQRYLFLQDTTRLHCLLEASLQLARSTRPQDCNTAAYLLRIITQQPLLYHIIGVSYVDQLNTATCLLTVKEALWRCGLNDATQGMHPTLERDGIFKEPESCKKCLYWHDTRVLNDFVGRCCVMLTLLLGQLDSQVTVARHNLVQAASTQPMYPTMHCIRYLLRDVDLKCVDNSPMWCHLLKCLINMCFLVATVVAPVVTNCSPEGFIPDEFCSTDVTSLGDAPLPPVDKISDVTAANKVFLMPEYLTVCCWRSAKEASLLLGQLLETAPVINPNVDMSTSELLDSPRTSHQKGLLSVKQIHAVGEYFINQLLQSRHRGAFELAYAGFVKMTTMLWKSAIDQLHELPKLWLDSVIDDIKSGDPQSRLCATRRSAGVPFYIQALVCTEPVTTGRVCLKAVISELLVLTRPSLPESDIENTAQVHALNILRALYRDTRLADDVFPFIADGLQVAVLGCASKFWAIRNSSSLLFSTLITRIFGVKRSKDDTYRRNCLTGRVFFNRFPPLYKFFLIQLMEATDAIGTPGKLNLHPSLFPTLLVLGRLLPSVLEGADTKYQLSAFFPHIIRCANSAVYKIRVMAACALGPLVATDEVTAVISSLLKSLPMLATHGANQNHIHGVLLQVLELLQAAEDFNISHLVHTAASGLEATHWLGTRENMCFLTKTTYVKVVYAALSHDWSDQSEAVKQQRCHLEENLVTTVLSYINTSDVKLSSSPGEAEFCETMAAKLLLYLVDKPSVYSVSCRQLLLCLLSCHLYEVRLQTLLFLWQALLPAKQGSSMWNGANTECRSADSGQSVAGQETTTGLLAAQHVHVFAKLVSMASGEESHPECLAKVLQVLCRHPMSSQGPWLGPHGAWTTQEMLQFTMTLTGTSRDEVRYAAIELTGRLMASLHIKSDCERCLLCEWMQLLADSCSTHHSKQLRLGCAAALIHSCHLLCATNLGGGVLQLWSVVMRLLEDEDDSVRTTMATVIHRLSSYIPARFKELCHVDVQPEMAMKVCLSVLTHTWCSDNWGACVRLLLLWIQHDLQPAFFTPENTVRLFDKGEMNTFSDPINFTNLVACHLTEFLSSSLEMTDSETRRGCVGSTVMNNSGTDNATEPDLVDESRWDDRLRLLEQECDVLFDHLGSLLDQVHCASPQCPFVEASQYRVTTVALYRSLVALQCLCVFTSTDNKHKMCHMCQTVSAKLTRSGGSLNALLALVLQQRQ